MEQKPTRRYPSLILEIEGAPQIVSWQEITGSFYQSICGISYIAMIHRIREGRA